MRSKAVNFWLRLYVEVLGQAFNLLDVKHRVAFQEGDFVLDFVPLGILFGALEGIGIHDQ